MAKLDLNVLAVEEGAKFQVIEFKGELDKSNNLDVRNALTKFIENFTLNTLVFDLKYFDFINSEGVGMLVSLYYKLVKDGRGLVIVSAQPRVADVFNIIGLSKIVPLYDSIDQALTNI